MADVNNEGNVMTNNSLSKGETLEVNDNTYYKRSTTETFL